MSDKKLKIIFDGDSWVFGCEIVDPEIAKNYDKDVHPGRYDHLANNDEYRITKIFPTYLSEMLEADYVNLSFPADDNNTILNRTVEYISSNYIDKGLNTDNLLVIVGWSSPERNSFWYKDDEISTRFRLWPQVEYFDTENQREFWKIYVQYLWNKEEYLPRYVMNVLQFQNFCNQNKIKWLCFNSFYQTPNKNIDEWQDMNVSEELKHIDVHSYSTNVSLKKEREYKRYKYLPIWNQIDPIRFYKKNYRYNTFKSFVDKLEIENKYNGWHPSPESHKFWAEELKNYILKNKLI